MWLQVFFYQYFGNNLLHFIVKYTIYDIFILGGNSMLNVKETEATNNNKVHKYVFLIPLIFILVGLLFSFFVIKNISCIFDYSDKTTGVCNESIEEYDRVNEQNYYNVYYTYKVDEKEYIAILEDYALKTKIGAKKTIYYQKENPEDYFMINTYSFCCKCVAAIFCIIVGITLYISIRREQ